MPLGQLLSMQISCLNVPLPYWLVVPYKCHYMVQRAKMEED